jgi:hypothetical protein
MRLALLLICAPANTYARIEPGTLPWELQGDGSLLNHLSKLETDMKQGHRFMPLRSTPSYDRNGEVLMMDTAQILRMRGMLEGKWKGRTGKWLLFMVPDERVIYREAERIVFLEDLEDTEQLLLDAGLQEKAAEEERHMARFWAEIFPVIIERVAAILLFISIIVLFARVKRVQMNAAKRMFESVPAEWKLKIDKVVPYQMRSATYHQVGYTGELHSGRVVNIRPRMGRAFKDGYGLYVQGRWLGPEPVSRIKLSFGAYDHLGRKEAHTMENAGTGRVRPSEHFAIDFVPREQSGHLKFESIGVQDERSGSWLTAQPMVPVPRPNEFLTHIAKVTLLTALAVMVPFYQVGFDPDRLNMNIMDGLALLSFITATLLALFNITPFWVVGFGCILALGTNHSIAFLVLGGLYMGIIWTRRKSFSDFLRAQDSSGE